jgi:hypothetical protein
VAGFETQNPRKQHLISQVLLKQFATSGPNAQLRAFDLDYGKSKLKAPAAVGWRKDFIEHEPAQAEKVWQSTEERLGLALAAARAGSVFDDAASVDCLKRAIALHFIRRDVIKEITEATRARAVKRVQALHHAGGDPNVLQAIIRARLNETRSSDFAAAMEHHYLKSGETAASGSLEVYHSREMPLLLGDSAVISFDGQQPGYVPFANAGTHVLPVGRNHLISLGPTERAFDLSPAAARYMNRLQIQSARRHVFYHPHDDLDDHIRSVPRR